MFKNKKITTLAVSLLLGSVSSLASESVTDTADAVFQEVTCYSYGIREEGLDNKILAPQKHNLQVGKLKSITDLGYESRGSQIHLLLKADGRVLAFSEDYSLEEALERDHLYLNLAEFRSISRAIHVRIPQGNSSWVSKRVVFDCSDDIEEIPLNKGLQDMIDNGQTERDEQELYRMAR